jgi:hypothetical protein
MHLLVNYKVGFNANALRIPCKSIYASVLGMELFEPNVPREGDGGMHSKRSVGSTSQLRQVQSYASKE